MSRKNPFKGALITSLVALVAVALAYFVLAPRQERKEKDKEKSALLWPDLERGRIAELRFENANGSFQLKRKANPSDDWILTTNQQSFEADKGAVDGMLSTILAAKREQSVTSAGDLKGLGLEPPKYKLALSSGTQALQSELAIGEDTPVDYLVYGKWSDKADVFLTTRSLRFALDKKASDLRNKKVFPALNLNQLSKVEIKTLAHDKVPATTLSFEKDPDSKKWVALLPGNHKAAVIETELEKWLKNVSDTTVVSFPSDNPKDRPRYGFRNPLAKLSYTVEGDKKTVDKASEWILAQAWEKGSTEAGKKEKASNHSYWGKVDEDSTFEVSDTFKDQFKVDLMRFRPKEVLKIAKASVDSLVINGSEKDPPVELKKEGSGWTAHNGGSAEKGQAAKTDVVEKLIDGLSNLKVKTYLDNQSPAQLGLSRPSRVIEVREQKDGKTQTVGTLVFGKKLSPSTVVVRADGMDAAAEVEFKLDELVPPRLEAYVEKAAEKPAAPGTAGSTPSKGAATGGKKVKLEPTVSSTKEIRKLPAPIVQPGKKYTAVITLAKGGTITITFAPDKAPYTVSNFLHLARNHFYDGVKFHRVIPQFVAQGGDPTGTGTGGPGYKFDNEDNDLKHERGSISMAHAGRNTNGSQFFLVLEPQPHLNGVHTVFGKITQGLDVLDSIKAGDVMKTVEVFEE